jgi:hypothetical protein
MIIVKYLIENRTKSKSESNNSKLSKLAKLILQHSNAILMGILGGTLLYRYMSDIANMSYSLPSSGPATSNGSSLSESQLYEDESNLKSKLLRYGGAALTGLLWGSLIHNMITSAGESKYDIAKFSARADELGDVTKRLTDVSISLSSLKSELEGYKRSIEFLDNVINAYQQIEQEFRNAENPEELKRAILDLKEFYKYAASKDDRTFDELIKQLSQDNIDKTTFNEIKTALINVVNQSIQQLKNEGLEQLTSKYNEVNERLLRKQKMYDFLKKEFDKLRKPQLNESNNLHSILTDKYIQFLKEESRRFI